MEWNEIARDSLGAATKARADHARSAVSRAYYAAHAVLAHALLSAGYMPDGTRQTQPHEAQPRLIGVHLANKGPRVVRELRATMRRLHSARIDADYNSRVTIDKQVSLRAIRDAFAVFAILEVAL